MPQRRMSIALPIEGVAVDNPDRTRHICQDVLLPINATQIPIAGRETHPEAPATEAHDHRTAHSAVAASILIPQDAVVVSTVRANGKTFAGTRTAFEGGRQGFGEGHRG
jgi:hypothetical protein